MKKLYVFFPVVVVGLISISSEFAIASSGVKNGLHLHSNNKIWSNKIVLSNNNKIQNSNNKPPTTWKHHNNIIIKPVSKVKNIYPISQTLNKNNNTTIQQLYNYFNSATNLGNNKFVSAFLTTHRNNSSLVNSQKFWEDVIIQFDKLNSKTKKGLLDELYSECETIGECKKTEVPEHIGNAVWWKAYSDMFSDESRLVRELIYSDDANSAQKLKYIDSLFGIILPDKNSQVSNNQTNNNKGINYQKIISNQKQSLPTVNNNNQKEYVNFYNLLTSCQNCALIQSLYNWFQNINGNSLIDKFKNTYNKFASNQKRISSVDFWTSVFLNDQRFNGLLQKVYSADTVGFLGEFNRINKSSLKSININDPKYKDVILRTAQTFLINEKWVKKHLKSFNDAEQLIIKTIYVQDDSSSEKLDAIMRLSDININNNMQSYHLTSENNNMSLDEKIKLYFIESLAREIVISPDPKKVFDCLYQRTKELIDSDHLHISLSDNQIFDHYKNTIKDGRINISGNNYDLVSLTLRRGNAKEKDIYSNASSNSHIVSIKKLKDGQWQLIDSLNSALNEKSKDLSYFFNKEYRSGNSSYVLRAVDLFYTRNNKTNNSIDRNKGIHDIIEGAINMSYFAQEESKDWNKYWQEQNSSIINQMEKTKKQIKELINVEDSLRPVEKEMSSIIQKLTDKYNEKKQNIIERENNLKVLGQVKTQMSSMFMNKLKMRI